MSADYKPIAIQLDHALRSLMTALIPDPKLPQAQHDAYLNTVAKPRAQQAIADFARFKHQQERGDTWCDDCRTYHIGACKNG